MVFLMKMVFAIELLKHTNNQYGIVQLSNLRIRVAISTARSALRIYPQALATLNRSRRCPFGLTVTNLNIALGLRT